MRVDRQGEASHKERVGDEAGESRRAEPCDEEARKPGRVDGEGGRTDEGMGTSTIWRMRLQKAIKGEEENEEGGKGEFKIEEGTLSTNGGWSREEVDGSDGGAAGNTASTEGVRRLRGTTTTNLPKFCWKGGRWWPEMPRRPLQSRFRSQTTVQPSGEGEPESRGCGGGWASLEVEFGRRQRRDPGQANPEVPKLHTWRGMLKARSQLRRGRKAPTLGFQQDMERVAPLKAKGGERKAISDPSLEGKENRMPPH
ncbi:hypothetical protein AMTR_s00034p00223170 [Amborella trichopoda]|uniref:Uncharacterized protein n=1 Tax=Amborella trichopoda TaxID=13333 RepID=W1PVY5_AMBTC|nr:hypothetical protein AMTR_s00034p00223170 [Amborella trichopoda]